MRADDVRTPCAVRRDAGEECIVKGLLDAVEVLRLAGKLPKLAVEPYPVSDVAELRHAVDAALRMHEVVKVAGGTHGVKLLTGKMSPERLRRS